MSHPNVVFVFADQMRAQAAGYAGNPDVRTPALDRLAAQSVNCVNAVSGNPVCCPYRASLMTGQYPLTHGVYINDVPLETDAPALAEVFAAHGYQTAYIGKWHLYGSPDGAYGRRRAYIPAEDRLGFDDWKAFECNHDYMASPYFEGDDPEPQMWEGYDALAQTRDACEYIQEHAEDDDPFFLMLSWGTPHNPYDQVPARYRALFKDRPLSLRPNVPEDRWDQAVETLRGYYAHIAAIDDGVGMLLDALEGAGLADETVFVFTSDHGDMHGSQGVRRKQVPWDESVLVPLLVRYPGALGDEGRALHTPINTPDLMPTLLGVCGLPIPGTVEGQDYTSLMQGGEDEAEVGDFAPSAFLNYPVSFAMSRAQGLPAYRGVRTARYTYVRTHEGPWLLYDNVEDPYQMHNLCADPAYARIQARLETELAAWLSRLGDRFLPGSVYLERDGLAHYREVSGEWGRIETPWTVKQGDV
jgi:arylsulfatase A-like enzyme